MLSWKNEGNFWTETSDLGTMKWSLVKLATVEGNAGVVVRREDNTMEVFIPFLGSEGAAPDYLRQRHGGTNWSWALLGRMIAVK
jgi:hypothetical protein